MISATPASRTVTRLLAWLLLAAIVALTLVPPGWRPVTGVPHKLEHFATFVVAGGAFALAYPGHAWLLGLMAVLFTAALELMQLLSPGRHARWSDFLVDAAGACIAIAVVATFARVRRQSDARPSLFR